MQVRKQLLIVDTLYSFLINGLCIETILKAHKTSDIGYYFLSVNEENFQWL